MRPRHPPKSSSSDSTSTTSSTSSAQGSSSDKGRCNSFLIPETYDLINTSSENIAQLERNRSSSSWTEYLYDTAMEKWSCEQERLELRHTLLQDMKHYYGNQKWKSVESIEDAELYNDNEKQKIYLDLLVLYGEHSKRRSKYVDRQGDGAAKTTFRRRRLNADMTERESGLRALLRRLGASMIDDYERLTIR